MGKLAGDVVFAPGEPAVQVFTTSGTWNKPNGVRAVRVRCIGAGGGSGGVAGAASGNAMSGGGGGGGYSEAIILAANLGATENVTVGTGGTAGASGVNAGGTGGTSSFGSHATANGGQGGAGMAATTGNQKVGGGIGGTASDGDINIQGGDGGNGTVFAGFFGEAAFGGPSGGGMGGLNRPSVVTLNLPGPGRPYGGGASGALAQTTSGPGAAGADGAVTVESIF